MEFIGFLFVQSLAIFAWLFLVASYYRKNTNEILVFQIISAILSIIHYALLGAFSGLYICFFELIVNFLYYKTDVDGYIYAASIPFYIIGCILTYQVPLDIFPTIASIIDGGSLIMKKKSIVIGAIITNTLWVLYDFQVGSYSGMITDALIIISNMGILIFHYKLIKKDSDFETIEAN